MTKNEDGIVKYSPEEITALLEDLQAILDVRIRFNNTYNSVSAQYDMDDEGVEVITIRWYNHKNNEQRMYMNERKTIIPIIALEEEIQHHKEELLDEIPNEEMMVLEEILLSKQDE